MTASHSPLPPHQDPQHQTDPAKVSMLEYVTSLIAMLDRRFDTLHQDLKDAIAQRFDNVENRFSEKDLRDNQRYDAQREAVAAVKEAVGVAMTAAEKATTKAETAADKRFESVNEFRQTLTDQAGTFMPRSEAEARLTSMSEKIDDLKANQATSAGRGQGLQASWVYLLGAMSLIAIVVNMAIYLITLRR